jgi:hypothetical protein
MDPFQTACGGMWGGGKGAVPSWNAAAGGMCGGGNGAVPSAMSTAAGGICGGGNGAVPSATVTAAGGMCGGGKGAVPSRRAAKPALPNINTATAAIPRPDSFRFIANSFCFRVPLGAARKLKKPAHSRCWRPQLLTKPSAPAHVLKNIQSHGHDSPRSEPSRTSTHTRPQVESLPVEKAKEGDYGSVTP